MTNSAQRRGIVPGPYRKRIVDGQIENYLRLFGAVEISGTKWCGKTWSALAHGESVTYVDRGHNLQIVSADPAYALQGAKPHVIDEWQLAPAIWDTVRHSVDDAAGEKGLWLLTGSSAPLEAGAKKHSGAGRIGRIRMHTMTLQESGDSAASVSLAGLFKGEAGPGQCPDGIADLAALVCRGGWPGEIGAAPEDSQIVVREYLRLVFEEGVPRFGGDAAIARRVALSLARNLGQSPTNKTLARDVYALGSDDVPTDGQMREVSRYVDMLKRLYVVDEVPGWVPSSRSPQRMRTKPKLYFADPSLAIGLLGLSPDSLLQDWQTFGLAFENMVMRDISVYAAALPSVGGQPLRYYRDDSGLEADAVIELADGSWAGIEVKLGQDGVDEGAASLLRLSDKVQKNKQGRTPAPVFLAVVTGMGEAAYRRPDGVYVVPVRSLGA